MMASEFVRQRDRLRRLNRRSWSMTRNAAVSLASAFILGIASLATISTDADARVGARGGGRGGRHAGGGHRGGMHAGGGYRGGAAVRGGAYRGGSVAYRGGAYVGAPVRRGVAVGVGAAAAGAYGAYGAYGAPACGYYPNPP